MSAERHQAILEELHELYRRKNQDYGSSFEQLFAEFGLTSSVIRLQDKLTRLKTLAKQEALVKDESIRDTLMDLCNYSLLTIMELDRNGLRTVQANHRTRDTEIGVE